MARIGPTKVLCRLLQTSQDYSLCLSCKSLDMEEFRGVQHVLNCVIGGLIHCAVQPACAYDDQFLAWLCRRIRGPETGPPSEQDGLDEFEIPVRRPAKRKREGVGCPTDLRGIACHVLEPLAGVAGREDCVA